MSEKPSQKKTFGEKFGDVFIPKAGDTSRQRSAKIVADIAAVLVILAVVVVIVVVGKFNSKAPAQSDISSAMSMPGSSEPIESNTEEETKDVYDPEAPFMNTELGVLEEFTDLYKENSDFIGYLKIDGTSVDTPVVKGADNTYYLNRTFDKKNNAYGVAFADYRTTLSKDGQSDNTIIYGHSTKDGELFGSVKSYSDIEYYKQHPYLTFDTIYGKAEYKVVGAFLARVYADASKQPDPEEFNYHTFVDAEGDGRVFSNFMDEVNKRSFWTNPDVDVMYGDKLVTLSTCDSEINAFGAPTEYRQVLIARKIRVGEVMDVDVSKAVINEDMIMPKAWQQKFGKENPYK